MINQFLLNRIARLTSLPPPPPYPGRFRVKRLTVITRYNSQLRLFCVGGPGIRVEDGGVHNGSNTSAMETNLRRMEAYG